MCVSIASLGVIAMIGGAVTSIVGQVTSAVGQSQQSSAQAQMQMRNAKLQEEQIIEAEKAKQLENERLQKESGHLMGSGLNQVGASGVDMGSGSVDTWFQEVEQNMRDDVFFNSRNVDQQKWGMKNEATNMRYQAKVSRASGKNSLFAGGIGALGTGLSATGGLMLSDKTTKGFNEVKDVAKSGWNKMTSTFGI